MDYFIKRRPDDSPGSVWRLESGSTQQRWDWASGKWVADFDMVRLMGDGALDPVSQQEAEAAIASRSKGVREAWAHYAEHGDKATMSPAVYATYHPGRGVHENPSELYPQPAEYVPSQAVVDALTEVKRLEDHERLIVIGPDGTVRLRKDGTKSHVQVMGNEDPLFKDSIFVHNHPSGMPPSDSDIALAVSNDAAGFYAIGSDEWGEGWTYHVLRPSSGWPLAEGERGLSDALQPYAAGSAERHRRIWALAEALNWGRGVGESRYAIYQREANTPNIADWAERNRYATLLAMNEDRMEVMRRLGAQYARSSWTP
jgi:hypothetical protein